jgi:transposase
MEHDTPPTGISVEDWAATPLAVRQSHTALVSALLHYQQLIAQLQHDNAALHQRVSALEAQLNQHSQNSSKPPSSDPPSAPPRRARTPRGRKAGAQVGHPPQHRPDPSPEQITAVEDHYPDTCPHCHDTVPLVPHPVCLPLTQYVWDIPLISPSITAHHYHTVCCPTCGDLVTAPRPPEVAPGAFGSRAAAAVSILHGDYHLSHRSVERLLLDFFDLPISLGSVVSLQAVGSSALAPVYAEVQTAVQHTDRCNIDETGWKEAGKRRWLWTMVTAVATFFVVLSSRNGPGLRHLLGASYAGIVGSDRHRPYLALPPEQHQLCWSHLMRNFQALVDRGGSVAVWGADLLALSRVVFRLWHLFREGTIERATLQAAIAPVQAAIHALLVAGSQRAGAPEGMCWELLTHEQALWTFVREENVEPTNNAAEQALRPAVLWRKGCFGAHSAEGNRFVERILTVSATCRKQDRHLLTFVTEAIDAYWAGRPAPALLPISIPTPQ